ncbi:F0F1 ATP synthase subunit gamma [Chitinophaga sedimenti]|uniref:F0F1 ATP synthase subunit gamma n=1 Tax=Chitinophaga sedimenti TaxID=2033606 RepID=UPI0027DF5FA9|nr:FoF1 ATP synthase subunit gamma [Chitinophaga sedimenti]
MISSHWNIFSGLSFDSVKSAAAVAMEGYVNEQFDAVELVYSQFRNAATQVFTTEQFLPVAKVENTASKGIKADYIFEPEKEVLIAELMPKILNTQFFKAVLDGQASEHGARMTAMDKASENAAEILRTLKISYNRARQAAITTELTEIVSGAAALVG